MDQHKDGKKPSKPSEQEQSFPPGFPPGFPIPGQEQQEDVPQEASRRHPLGFEIPHIEGAPGNPEDAQGYPSVYEENYVYTEYPVYEEETYTPRELTPDETPAKDPEVPEYLCSDDKKDDKWLPLLKTPETARDAVIYAEIFGKPKALRRRH